jgi:hypothetical protein
MSMRISRTHPAVLAATAGATAMLALVGCAATAGPNSEAARSAIPSGAASGSAPGSTGLARATPRALATTSAPASTPSALGKSIFSLALDNVSLTVTPAGLYLTWYRPRPSGSVTGEVLARADAATGLIVAQREFGSGLIGAPLLADGSLWVTDSTPGSDPTPSGDRVPGRESLLRLNPATLTVTGKLTIGGARYGGGGAGPPGQVAFAGGAIWMDGGGLLVRVNPASVTAELTITLRFPVGTGLAEHPIVADDSSVAASLDGTVLIDAEANNGIGTVQRRDPVTGALLASSAVNGVVTPSIAEVTDSGVWLAAPTGMMGYVERVGTESLSPVSSTEVGGTNAIKVRFADRALWITNPVGGATRNYCADPTTGRVRAPLPLPNLGQDQLLAVGPRVLYYAAFSSSANGWRIATVPVPAGCG